MELGVRDWMIIVGVLLIVAVLLDGYRRVRNERRGKIRMSLNKQYLNSGEPDEPDTCELPNGGARTINRRGKATSRREEPRVGDVDALNLDQSVPLLMESVANANLAGELSEEPFEVEPDLFKDLEPASPSRRQTDDSSVTEDDSEAVAAVTVDDDVADDELAVAEDIPEEAEPSAPSFEAAPAYTGQQEIIVVNVVAKDEPFNGADLLHILLACDLRHGKMDIFHRYEQAGGRGPVQFSVVNSVEPGTFDLDNIDGFTTPGVCFFMSVPGPEEPINAFECMVETAQCLVKNLDGELLDESRSAMTAQTLEHCRQRLQEFERRQLAQA